MREAIIIEHNCKGECWRYALTYDEFTDKFNPWMPYGVPYPKKEGSVFKFRSNDHMWYKPCAVGRAEWTRFFTNMTSSMFAGIITSSTPYVRESYMISLKNFLPQKQANVPNSEHNNIEAVKGSNDLSTDPFAAQLVSVARNNIFELADRSDLETRNNDSDDFFTTSVWSLKAALVDAYNLGREQALAQSVGEKPSGLDSIIKHADARAIQHKEPLNKSYIER